MKGIEANTVKQLLLKEAKGIMGASQHGWWLRDRFNGTRIHDESVLYNLSSC